MNHRLDWLPLGCCTGSRQWPRTQSLDEGEGERGGGEGEKGVCRLDLTGLGDLRTSVVLIYSPAGNTCLLKLVGEIQEGG